MTPEAAVPDQRRAPADEESDGPSRRLAALVNRTCWDAIPEAVRREARRSLLNFFAVALGGCTDPTLSAAVRTLRPFRSGDLASLVGRTERFDVLNAAALNAMAANVYDFDDTHFPTILHPSAPVAPTMAAVSPAGMCSDSPRITSWPLP